MKNSRLVIKSELKLKKRNISSFCHGYNGIGLLKEIGNGNIATAYANTGNYDTAGHLTSMKGGNSLTTTETWNKTKGLLNSYSWGISGKSANTLSWNIRGNITAQTKNGISYTYSYDKKNQLAEEKKGTSKLNSWTYDAAGNRKTEAKNGNTAKTVTCYTKSDLVKSDGTWNYNYDNNGNMTYKGKTDTVKTNGELFEGWTFKANTGEVWKYEYDLCNRLVKVKHSNTGTNNLIQVTEYKYDFRGLMVCRTTGTGSSAVSEYFAYDNEGKLIYTEKGSVKHDYIYANGKLWCEIVTSGNTKNTYYHHTDHLGTTVCITNTSGAVVWQCEEDAFGKEKDKTNSSFTPNFTGKLLDLNTGLYYFNARWYAPDMGRFITEDPARDGRNWFVYCRNNPLKYIDPHGLFYYTKDGQQHSNSDYSGVTGNSNDRNQQKYSNLQENNESLICEKTAGYLYLLYRNDKGTDKTLRQLGLLKKVRNAIRSDPKLTGKRGDTIFNRFIKQIVADEGTYFKNSYNFLSVNFAIGRATVEGQFYGDVYKNTDGTTHIEGEIIYSFEDVFTDPYDLLNIIPGEWNPDGKPYKITDTWSEKINGDY